MSRKSDAMKKAFVALGFGSAVTDYEGRNTVEVLKELAVYAEAAPTVDDVRATSVAGVLKFIADNKGSEEHEPFDLAVTATHATVTVKRAGKTLTPASDILYNKDKLKITVDADEGYEIATLTVNGTAIESGDTFTVNGHNVTIVATGTIQTFDLDRTATDCTIAVTKDGNAVSDGTDVLTYGDEIVITATVEEGYEMKSLKVNGEDFTSGETLTVSSDVEIVGVAESESESA